ncbi:class GN sortase [Shewanella woodyi]|uniref:class GN sortase n=1 Tax=Shewanella woodyi TaxID=60961 RepID=UPI0007E9F446|nr:class GN sortase [Shewanella woodyi]
MLKSVHFHRAIILMLLALAGIFLGQGVYMQAKAHFAQYLIEQAWKRTLVDQQPHKPWSWADTYPVAQMTFIDEQGDKEGLLTGDSMYVLEGASGRNLAFGPAQLQDGRESWRGESRIIAGHNDTHFSILEGVKQGKQIKLQESDGTEVIYQVVGTQVVHESDTQVLNSDSDKRLTLITCYPFHSLTTGGPLRFIVYAEVIG